MDPPVDKQDDLQELVAEHTVNLLQDISGNTGKMIGLINSFLSKLRNEAPEETSTEKGLSFLEVRNLTLLNYIIDIGSIVLEKCRGESIEGIPAIERLVELRTAIEKMRPIHFKLKYRIEKLIRAASTQSVDVNDPINFRPRPENLVTGDTPAGDEEKISDDQRENSAKNKKAKGVPSYVPPKVSAVRYEDDSVEARKERAVERAKKRALSSSIIRELRSEFDEAPEEISETSVGRKKLNKKVEERTRYEEDNFVRLNLNKREKRREESSNQHLLTVSDLGRDLTRFEDVSALHEDLTQLDLTSGPKRKKKKVMGKKKSGGNKRFKRRK